MPEAPTPTIAERQLPQPKVETANPGNETTPQPTAESTKRRTLSKFIVDRVKTSKDNLHAVLRTLRGKPKSEENTTTPDTSITKPMGEEYADRIQAGQDPDAAVVTGTEQFLQTQPLQSVDMSTPVPDGQTNTPLAENVQPNAAEAGETVPSIPNTATQPEAATADTDDTKKDHTELKKYGQDAAISFVAGAVTGNPNAGLLNPRVWARSARMEWWAIKKGSKLIGKSIAWAGKKAWELSPPGMIVNKINKLRGGKPKVPESSPTPPQP